MKLKNQDDETQEVFLKIVTYLMDNPDAQHTDKLVFASNNNVDTVDGHVTLNGIAADHVEINRAVELGLSVDGVKSVHSNLVIPSKELENE